MSIELGAGAKCMRVLFIFFNVLFAVIGLVIMSVGAWLYSTGSTLDYVTGNNYANGAAIIIAAGIFTALLCGLGVLAAVYKNRPLLGIFIGILVFIIIVEIVAGILGFVYLGEVNSLLDSRLQDAINNYGSDPNTASVFNKIQSNLKCCGVNSYADYYAYQNLSNTYFCMHCSLPDSCSCSPTAGGCTTFINNASTQCGGGRCPTTSQNQTSVYATGCLAAWNAYPIAKQITYTVGGFGIAVGLFEILGVLVGCGLICCITSSKKHTLV